MNVLFLTLVEFETLQDRNIYTDLLREFVKNGHEVYVISPIEKRRKIETHLGNEEHARILRLQIGNTQKTNIIEKGVSTVMIEPTYKKAIKKYFSDIKFDLVLYSTPPITLVSAIEYVKKRDGAKTYLMLKDIFPQNAVDIGMMSTTGVKGILYKHFRNQEKKLYKISDRIGCMSQANVDYVLKHNKEVRNRSTEAVREKGKPIVEICPNSIELQDMSITEEERRKLRDRYNLPQDKKIFIYGGNLGKPQCIPFMIDCLDSQRDNDDAFFLIVGSGTEYHLIEEYIDTKHPANVTLYQALPKDDYDRLVAACDVGMIFLDHRFTIPNFPSRLLSYMQVKIPVLAVTDPNTDIGNVITGIDKDGNKTHEPFGWWCESDSVEGFRNCVKKILSSNFNEMGECTFNYMINHYNVCNVAEKIIKNMV